MHKRQVKGRHSKGKRPPVPSEIITKALGVDPNLVASCWLKKSTFKAPSSFSGPGRAREVTMSGADIAKKIIDCRKRLSLPGKGSQHKASAELSFWFARMEAHLGLV